MRCEGAVRGRIEQAQPAPIPVTALPGPVLDTTGAGDCFSGTLMAALAQGQALDSAIRRAICASALSTTRLGVIEAIPERDEVEAMLQSGGGRVK